MLLKTRIHDLIKKPNITNNYFSPRFFISFSADPSESEKIEKEKIKRKESKRQWREKNKENIKETKRQWYEKNQEKIKETKREWYEKNKEKTKEDNRQWREKNKEKVKESIRRWREKNPEKMKEYMLQREKKNPERTKEINRQWKEKNKEKIKEFARRGNEKKKEKRKEDIEKKKQIDPKYVDIPRYNWRDKESVKSFFDGKISKVLGIESLSDWYHVSDAQLKKNGGSGAISRHKTLGFALKFAYPNYSWVMKRFQHRGKTAAQRWLLLVLKGLLPTNIVPKYNFRQDPALLWEGLRYHSQFDIFIEELRLALEYQGEQHYMDIPSPNSLSDRQKKDSDKLVSSVNHGITLVHIPYWWDMTSDSLSSTLHQYLPDVFPKTSSPAIPTELPADYSKYKKPGLLTNKNIMQGYDFEQYENEINVEGWYMSEKLDGIRAYWDGKKFLSKNNNIINVPELFKQLPSFALDGELWGGYEDNQSVLTGLKLSCGVHKRKKQNLDWTKIKFCVFDAPNVEGTYEKRHLFLQNNLTPYCNSNISLIPMQKCNGKDHLENHLKEIVQKGGEGIMIHHPDLVYQQGRTKRLLKVKKFYESSIKYLGRSENSFHFKCKQNNGSEVWLKVMGGYYERHPEIGSMIPVKHQGFFANSQNFKYPVLIEPIPAEEQKQVNKQEKKFNNNE